MNETIPFPAPTQEQLIALAGQFADEEGTVLLLSGGNRPTTEKSFLGLFPREIVTIPARHQFSNPWAHLINHTNKGKWFGFLEYELGRWSVPGVKIPQRSSGGDLAFFVRPGLVLEVNHKTDTAYVLFDDLSFRESKLLVDIIKGEYNYWEPKRNFHSLSSKRGMVSPESYYQQLETVLEWIKAGETYQVNISHQFDLHGVCHPYSLFTHMFLANPPPFAAYIHTKNRSIASLSPERFLKLKDGILESRPIKGTSPRGSTPEEDRRHLQYLQHSIKEQAELLMITDLMRNDLSKVCLPGSVEVPHLRIIEGYKNVFHAYSVVQGQALPDKIPLELLYDCFPAGSITGCPKGRAMELIDLLEQRPRGIYTGAIGWMDASSGECDFNVAIRTLDIRENAVSIQLGGGITIDSDPAAEYMETMYKGQTFFKVLGI